MESVTKYNVYAHSEQIASFDAQAPATAFAVRMAWRHVGVSLEVVEEVYAHVSSRQVRYVIDGKIHKCT